MFPEQQSNPLATSDSSPPTQDVNSGPLLIPAVIFFYSFMFIVNLVILNFFLAIVVDAYRRVAQLSNDPSEICPGIISYYHQELRFCARKKTDMALFLVRFNKGSVRFQIKIKVQ
jgi:hypothetical protein